MVTNRSDEAVEFQIIAESRRVHSRAAVTGVPGTNEIVHTPPSFL